MPRASWRGYLRLSLVSCAVYLTPATTRTKPIRLHQVWRKASAEPLPEDEPDRVRELAAGAEGIEEDEPDRDRKPAVRAEAIEEDRDFPLDIAESPPVRRIAIRPHDPNTGKELDKAEIVKGFEYERGQFVTFTKEELKALDVESSKIIDLEKFVPRTDIDPVYLDAAYYLYPDGPLAGETLRVIGAAMAEADVAGIGRLTLSRRERVVMIEPRGAGMALFSLRAADEVRPAQFEAAGGEIDAEMVAIAGAIIKQRQGEFDLGAYPDRYRMALQALIDAKMKGIPIKPHRVPEPAPVIDLMTALKRSLAKEAPASSQTPVTPARHKSTTDRRQRALLLPLPGSRAAPQEAAGEPARDAHKRRKKA